MVQNKRVDFVSYRLAVNCPEPLEEISQSPEDAGCLISMTCSIEAPDEVLLDMARPLALPGTTVVIAVEREMEDGIKREVKWSFYKAQKGSAIRVRRKAGSYTARFLANPDERSAGRWVRGRSHGRAVH